MSNVCDDLKSMDLGQLKAILQYDRLLTQASDKL